MLMDAQGVELFHLDSDPGETRDVSARYPVRARYLTSELVERSPALRQRWREPPPIEEGLSVTERGELQDALQALGYLQDGPAPPSAESKGDAGD